MPVAYVCFWCREPLHFVQGRGWRHPEGGLYRIRCPRCGDDRIYDLHCSKPVPVEDPPA